ncbi:ABC transporter substrate-binding protein [Acetobacteraceae bacterium H6797]|nr:ABC transporter substrate-binding protein [Acetobacteraceae bacterium H6797]
MSLTRRQFGLGLATAAAVSPLARPALAQQRTITVCAYSGLFEQNYVPAVIEPFMKAHPGIKVNYYGTPGSAQMLGMLRAQKNAPQLDVTLFDLTFAKAATDEGLFEIIPRDSMPVLSELSDRAFQPGVAGPAVTFDHLVMIYSPERVNPAPTSWREFWNPALKGKVTITGVPDLGGVSMVLLANMMEGERDYMRSVTKGINAMADMAPNVLTFDPKPDAYTFILNGTSSLGHGWNARAQLYAKQNPGKIASVVPKEGSVAIMNTINVVKGSANQEASREFIAYALSAEAQAAFSNRMFYGPVNTKAVLSDEAKPLLATPEQMNSWLPVNWLDVAKIRDNIGVQWRRRVITAG